MTASPNRRTVVAHELRLPELNPGGVPGARIVRRIARLAFVGILTLAAVLVGAASVVSMNINVEATGSLEPSRVWPVRARVAGAVDSVLVRTGDTVQAGQPVIRFDRVTADAAVARLEAQLGMQRVERTRLRRIAPLDHRQGESALAQAEARRSRAYATLRERMADYQIADDVDSLVKRYRQGRHVALDGAVADVLAAESDVEAARAQLRRVELAPLDVAKNRWEERQLEIELGERRESRARAIVRATADGVVLTEQLERLQGAVVREGETVLEVGDLGGWRATVAVRERDVQAVRVGDHALVNVPALSVLHPDPLPGRVASVAPEPASADRSIGTASVLPTTSLAPAGYRVTIALDSAPLDSMSGTVRRGYTAEVKIVTRSALIIVLVRDWVRGRLRGQRG